LAQVNEVQNIIILTKRHGRKIGGTEQAF